MVVLEERKKIKMNPKFRLNLSKIKNKSKKNLMDDIYSTKSPRLSFYEEGLDAGFTPRGDNYVSPESSPRTSEQTPRSPQLTDRRFEELEVGDEMKTIRKQNNVTNRTDFSLKDVQKQGLIDIQKMVEEFEENNSKKEEEEKPKSARASISLSQNLSVGNDSINQKKAKSFRSPRKNVENQTLKVEQKHNQNRRHARGYSHDENIKSVTGNGIDNLSITKYDDGFGVGEIESEFSEEEEENLKKLLNLRENKFEGAIFEDNLNIPFLEELEKQRKLNEEIKNFTPNKSLKSSKRNSAILNLEKTVNEINLQITREIEEDEEEKQETKSLDYDLKLKDINDEYEEEIKTENDKLDLTKIDSKLLKTHLTQDRYSTDVSQFDSPDIISPRFQPLKIPDSHPYSKSMKDITRSSSSSSKNKNEGVLKKVMQKLNKFGSASEEIGEYDSDDFDDDEETPRKVIDVDDLDQKPKKKSSMKDLISLAKKDSIKNLSNLTNIDRATKSMTPVLENPMIKSGAKSPRRQTIFSGFSNSSNS